MPGVPREEAEHSLDLDKTAKPVKQRLHHFAQDRKEAIRVEVTRLLAAGFIREVVHPDLLANPVLVKKKNSEWRICVDYTDLNKHCPKDPFPLPHIDQVIDSTVGCVLLSFLDCYSGYHQIDLKESDQEKASFITPFGACCYTTMTFGLKNAGATYQKAIQTCLQGQIGRNAEAYVNDVVVKTKRSNRFITDLSKMFENLWRFKWKLNPTNCVFSFPSGKLLGFIVNSWGIEANPTKVNAIRYMKPPRSKKDLMKLIGCMASLSRFISRLGDRGLPFFKLLRKSDKFEWNKKASWAFQELKELCCNWIRVVQALGILWNPVQVHRTGRRSPTPQRNPLGHLR